MIFKLFCCFFFQIFFDRYNSFSFMPRKCPLMTIKLHIFGTRHLSMNKNNSLLINMSWHKVWSRFMTPHLSFISGAFIIFKLIYRSVIAKMSTSDDYYILLFSITVNYHHESDDLHCLRARHDFFFLFEQKYELKMCFMSLSHMDGSHMHFPIILLFQVRRF